MSLFKTISEPMMVGYPQPLGFGDNTSFGYSKKDIWYTIKDGTWSDPNIWETVGGRRTDFPNSVAGLDDIYIKHTVLMASGVVGANNVTVTNTGILRFSTAFNFSFNGNLQVYGTLDLNNTASNLSLFGANNFVTTATNFTNSTITYARIGDQAVIPLPYHHLTILNIGTKYLTANTTLTGNFAMNAVNNMVLDLQGYNFTVTGTYTQANSTLRKTSSNGNIVFIGLFTSNGNQATYDLTGNPNVEFRGGVSFGGATGQIWNGSGTLTFTTNSQSITTGAVFTTTSFGTWNILISGAITLTVISSGAVTNSIILGGTIDGNNASSTLVNRATLNFNTTASLPSMATGVTDFTSFANVVAYNINGSVSILNTNYSSLTINGTGTKTGGASMSAINANLIVTSGSALTFGAAVTVTGTTTTSGATITTGGATTFVGLVTGGSSNVLATGSDAVEFRGGILISQGTGSGVWTLSTNSQNISASVGISSDILISGAITVTLGSGLTAILTGVLNGNNAGSTIDNRGTINYGNATRPMVTGVLATNVAANTFNYNRAGAQDVTGGTYRNLTLSVSGAKTLQGNVSVINTYSLTGTATKNDNGFTFGNP